MDSALALLLETGRPFDYAEAPALTLSGRPDLKIYDGLLIADLVAAGVDR